MYFDNCYIDQIRKMKAILEIAQFVEKIDISMHTIDISDKNIDLRYFDTAYT